MLHAEERDSLADAVFARIMELKHDCYANQIDSAMPRIAYNGLPLPEGKWARKINVNELEEMKHGVAIYEKAQKIFNATPDMKRDYFAVFKDKDNPKGWKILYQISHFPPGGGAAHDPGTGKAHGARGGKMVSWTFYPVGDELLIGDIQ